MLFLLFLMLGFILDSAVFFVIDIVLFIITILVDIPFAIIGGLFR